MKNIFKLLAVTALAGIAAASCTKDLNGTAEGNEATVSFSVTSPLIGTKAIADGNTVDKVACYIYDEADNHIAALDKTVGMNGGKATFSATFVTGKTYKFLFWAYKEGVTGYTLDAGNKTLTVDYSGVLANDESRDAFYNYVASYKVTGDKTEEIKLKRPFAQINFGVTAAEWEAFEKAGGAVTKTGIKVSGAANVLNFADGTVTGSADVVFAANTIPAEYEKLSVSGTDYRYLATTYVLAGKSQSSIHNITLTKEGLDGDIIVPNAPLQGNWRTNITGSLLTSTTNFNIVVEPGFEGGDPTKTVTTVAELQKVLNEAAKAGAGNSTIWINNDMSLGEGKSWTSVKVDGYNGAGVITIYGNGHTIKGLNAPLFAGGFAGKSGIVVKDLTLYSSKINDSQNNQGLGAFIGSVDSMEKIELSNCHLLNSEIVSTGDARVGGLIGWTSGYNGNGPVDTHVTIKNCSVENCKINAKGSVGAIIGHAGANPATYHTIESSTVTKCELTSTDEGDWRVGVVVGTANVGEVTINNTTESDNTLKQNSVTAPAGQSNLYGRFVPNTTGKLTIDGIDASQLKIVSSQEGLENVLSSSQKGAKVTLKIADGNYTLYDKTVAADKDLSITFIGNGIDKTSYKVGTDQQGSGYGTDYSLKGASATFKNMKIVSTNGDYKGFAHAKELHFEECTLVGQFAYTGTTTTFKNCTFVQESADHYNLQTYTADKYIFDNCVFKAASKFLYTYREQTTASYKVTFNNCKFEVIGKDETKKSAVSLKTDAYPSKGGAKYYIYFNNTTADDKVHTGDLTGSKLYSSDSGYNAEENKNTYEKQAVVYVDNKLVWENGTKVQ